MDLTFDRSMLDGYRRGERRVLEQIYEAYADDVAGYLRRGFTFESGRRTVRFRGAASAFQLEDWMHEVFLRAFSERARLQYDGLHPFGPYLRRIARNLVIDELRRKEHQLRVNVEEVPEPSAPEPRKPDPEHEAADGELRHLVSRFCGDLDPREREVYELRFERGLGHRDIASKTGLSPSKIKTSERKIREQFFRFLRRHGYLEAYEIGQSGWLRWKRGER